MDDDPHALIVKRSFPRNPRGMSLVEVLIAMSIVAILALGAVSASQLVAKTDALTRDNRMRVEWLVAKLSERAATLTATEASGWTTRVSTTDLGQPAGTTLTESITPTTLPSLYIIQSSLGWTDQSGAAQTFTRELLLYIP